MIHPRLFTTAATLGFLGILAGTFGAHGLQDKLPDDLLNAYEVGVRYHLMHAAALLAVAIAVGAAPKPRMAIVAGWLLATGVLVFSGSLYALCLTGARWLGTITPFGGVALLIGWALLAGWAMRCAAASGVGVQA